MWQLSSVHRSSALRAFGPPTGATEARLDVELAILAFTNRCGSNLLAEYMWKCGYFGQIGEMLNADIIEKRSNELSITSFEDYILELNSSINKRNRIFGIKASAEQIVMLYEYGIFDMFSGVKAVHSYRSDIVSQAVSYSIADQTKRWTSLHDTETDEVTYDYRDIRKRMNSLAKRNENINKVCAILEIPKVEICYENVVRSPRTQVRRILRHFSIDDKSFKIPKPVLKKQASGINEDFAERFVEQERKRLLKAK